MLKEFLDWATQKRAALMCDGYGVLLTVGSESSNRSARLDIDDATVFARITAWESGDIYLEIIVIETESTVFSRRVSISEPFQFDGLCSDFFVVLKLPYK